MILLKSRQGASSHCWFSALFCFLFLLTRPQRKRAKQQQHWCHTGIGEPRSNHRGNHGIGSQR